MNGQIPALLPMQFYPRSVAEGSEITCQRCERENAGLGIEKPLEPGANGFLALGRFGLGNRSPLERKDTFHGAFRNVFNCLQVCSALSGSSRRAGRHSPFPRVAQADPPVRFPVRTLMKDDSNRAWKQIAFEVLADPQPSTPGKIQPLKKERSPRIHHSCPSAWGDCVAVACDGFKNQTSVTIVVGRRTPVLSRRAGV